MPTLLGNDSLTGVTDESTFNSGTLYGMRHTASVSGTVTKAWFYDRLGYEIGAPKICIFTSTGTLIGSSGAISMTPNPGWKSVDWAGPSISSSTAYIIGVVGNDYLFCYQDNTSPTLVSFGGVTMSYTTPTNITPGSDQTYGTFAFYVEGTTSGGATSFVIPSTSMIQSFLAR